MGSRGGKGSISKLKSTRETAQLHKLEVEIVARSTLGRIVLCGDWSFTEKRAKRLLESIAQELSRPRPREPKLEVISACGGFLRFEWPDTPQGRKPSFADLILHAEGLCKRVFSPSLRRSLFSSTRYISFGIDAAANEDGDGERPHVELVALLDLKTGHYHWTGKCYPTLGQQDDLVRSDIASHFGKLSGKSVMLLGCHDLTAFNQRARHTSKGWRKALGNDFRKQARAKRPVLVLHHPHVTDTAKTWSSGWSGLQKALPTVERWLSAIRYSNAYKDGRRLPLRSDLEAVIDQTRSEFTVDIIIRRRRSPRVR